MLEENRLISSNEIRREKKMVGGEGRGTLKGNKENGIKRGGHKVSR